MQVSPQIEPTSLTQMLSHAPWQQYGSYVQISLAHALQVFVRCVPVEQIGCAQVVPPLDELVDVLLLDELEDEEPPEQDSPQIEPTSPTHMLSHLVVQQYESAAQTSVAHGSQPEVRWLPVEQIGCEHVPPLEDDEVLDDEEELEDEPLLDELEVLVLLDEELELDELLLEEELELVEPLAPWTMQAPCLFDHSFCTMYVAPSPPTTLPCWALQMSPISPADELYQASGGPLVVARPTAASVTLSIISCEETLVVLLKPDGSFPQPPAQAPP